MLDLKILGGRIRELRRERGLTQTAFAEILGVSFQAVSNWERGVAPPELGTLMHIAAQFSVLVDELLRTGDEPLCLGIDGGGTKTEFVVTTADGCVCERFVRGTSNPNDIGFDAALAVVSDGIRDALVRCPGIVSAFCGLAGISAGNRSEQMTARLREKYPSLRLQVRTDSANLFGIDDEADLAVICGTGSVVFVRQGDASVRLGGWGYLFDAAGSAYDIGRDAVAATLAAEDRREPRSKLAELLYRRLETENLFSAIPKLYDGGKPLIAALAPLVFEAFCGGDKTARAILEKSAARIGELLSDGVRLCGARKKAIAGGGLFTHHADVYLPMIRRYTDVEVLVSPYPPVFGACRQSVRLAGRAVAETFGETFWNTYGGEPA